MIRVDTGGERFELECELPWLEPVLVDWPSDDNASAAANDDVSLSIRVEADRSVFRIPDGRLVTRGVWSNGDTVLIEDACSSGFDMLVDTTDVRSSLLKVVARYRPRGRTSVANTVLRQRFRLLVRQALGHYPVMWRAGLRERVPLHASAFATGPDADRGVLLIGPGGIGKSTLLQAEAAAGARPTSDNLCVWGDGTAYGIVEPLRVEGAAGRRTTHGRREQQLPGRVTCVRPDQVVLLRRGGRPVVRRLEPEAAARALVAGTYSAGELRRYWSFAAVLALGTGRGPAHPPIATVARSITEQLPCVEACLGDRPGRRLTSILEEREGVS